MSRPTIFHDLPPEFKLIKTAKELSTIALRFRNCLADTKYNLALGTGKYAFFIFTENGGNVEAIISLEAAPDGSWWVDEVGYRDKSYPGRAVRERVVQLLRAYGMNVHLRSFQKAWNELVILEDMSDFDQLWDDP